MQGSSLLAVYRSVPAQKHFNLLPDLLSYTQYFMFHRGPTTHFPGAVPSHQVCTYFNISFLISGVGVGWRMERCPLSGAFF